MTGIYGWPLRAAFQSSIKTRVSSLEIFTAIQFITLLFLLTQFVRAARTMKEIFGSGLRMALQSMTKEQNNFHPTTHLHLEVNELDLPGPCCARMMVMYMQAVETASL